MTVCGKWGKAVAAAAPGWLPAGVQQCITRDGHCVFAQQHDLKQLLCSSHFPLAHCKKLVHNCSCWGSLAHPKASTDPSRSILPAMLKSKCTLMPGSLTSLQSNEVVARPFPPHTSHSWQRNEEDWAVQLCVHWEFLAWFHGFLWTFCTGSALIRGYSRATENVI